MTAFTRFVATGLATPLLLLFTLLPAHTVADDSTGDTRRKGILAYSGAETGQLIERGHGEDGWVFQIHPGKPVEETLAVVDSPVRAGNKSIRFYYHKDWDTNWGNNAYRSQIRTPSGFGLFHERHEYWVGFSVYLEDNENNRKLIETDWLNAQGWDFHRKKGAYGHNIRKGRWIAQIPSVDGKDKEVDIGPVKLGQWTDFVYHFKVSELQDGFWKIWMNGKSEQDSPVVKYRGRVSTGPEGDTLNFKIGIYRTRLGTNGETYAEYFFDEVRIGDHTSSFADVRPGDDKAYAPNP